MLAAVSVDWRVSLLTPPHTVISASIFNQTVVTSNLHGARTLLCMSTHKRAASRTDTQPYLLVVLNAHRQCVNEDGNHDSSAEVSAANNEFQFSLESRPATLAQPFLWLRHLCITAAGAATVAWAVTMTRAVAMA